MFVRVEDSKSKRDVRVTTVSSRPYGQGVAQKPSSKRFEQAHPLHDFSLSLSVLSNAVRVVTLALLATPRKPKTIANQKKLTNFP